MTTVYNPSTCREEEVSLVICPRCKGHGGCSGDEDGCDLCKKEGYVWKSTGGWVYPESGTPEDGRLY